MLEAGFEPSSHYEIALTAALPPSLLRFLPNVVHRHVLYMLNATLSAQKRRRKATTAMDGDVGGIDFQRIPHSIFSPTAATRHGNRSGIDAECGTEECPRGLCSDVGVESSLAVGGGKRLLVGSPFSATNSIRSGFENAVSPKAAQ